MTIRLSAQIMAHPARADRVPDLVAALDRPVDVTWDQINDRHDTGTRALAAFNPDCSHHLVLQEDAVVPVDLLAGVEAMLEFVPERTPVSLYVGRVRPFARAVTEMVEAVADDPPSFVVMPELNWGVGVVVPTELIPDLLAWYPQGRVAGYDARMGRWFATHGIDVWYTWPSLIDHADLDSLVPRHGRGRHAHTFIGADASALDVDWRRRVVRLNTTRTNPASRRRPRRMGM